MKTDMREQIRFKTDKKSAKEGEYVTLQWDCPTCPDAITLTIDDGYTKRSIPLADSGSTTLRVGPSKSKTRYTLTVQLRGKIERRHLDIRVKGAQDRKFVWKDKMTAWKDRLEASWNVFWAQTRYGWASLPKWKKALYLGLLVLWLILIIRLFDQPDPRLPMPAEDPDPALWPTACHTPDQPCSNSGYAAA